MGVLRGNLTQPPPLAAEYLALHRIGKVMMSGLRGTFVATETETGS